MNEQALNGQAAGALAQTLGVLTNSACNLGIPAPDQQLQLSATALIAVIAGSSRRRSAAASKAGTAAGLAALLGAPGLVIGVPEGPSFLLISQLHTLQSQCLQASLHVISLPPHALPLLSAVHWYSLCPLGLRLVSLAR